MAHRAQHIYSGPLQIKFADPRSKSVIASLVMVFFVLFPFKQLVTFIERLSPGLLCFLHREDGWWLARCHSACPPCGPRCVCDESFGPEGISFQFKLNESKENMYFSTTLILDFISTSCQKVFTWFNLPPMVTVDSPSRHCRPRVSPLCFGRFLRPRPGKVM